MTFAPFGLFAARWTYLKRPSIFFEGPSHLRSPSWAWDKGGRRVGWEWLCGDAPYSVSRSRHSSVSKDKRRIFFFFQGYHQAGAAWEEITQRRAGNETLLVAPLSLYFRQEVAFVLSSTCLLSVLVKKIKGFENKVCCSEVIRYRWSLECRTRSSKIMKLQSGASKHWRCGSDFWKASLWGKQIVPHLFLLIVALTGSCLLPSVNSADTWRFTRPCFLSSHAFEVAHADLLCQLPLLLFFFSNFL